MKGITNFETQETFLWMHNWHRQGWIFFRARHWIWV